ncbi:YopX family protein [Clostridium perfringens]|uniref:YopX family protein n=1 Tax=Clostridium perfringens TaxID=1502 RepID=UPI0039E840D6
MSRDIKFRAWDRYKERMGEIDKFHLKDKECSLILDNGDKIIHFYYDEIDIMQYTGLKDKNGKEIYEGDILERHGYWPIRIEYDKGCLMVRDLDEVRYNNLILNVPICNFESINDWKVIGNIYENPEVLRSEE